MNRPKIFCKSNRFQKELSKEDLQVLIVGGQKPITSQQYQNKQSKVSEYFPNQVYKSYNGRIIQGPLQPLLKMLPQNYEAQLNLFGNKNNIQIPPPQQNNFVSQTQTVVEPKRIREDQMNVNRSPKCKNNQLSHIINKEAFAIRKCERAQTGIKKQNIQREVDNSLQSINDNNNNEIQIIKTEMKEQKVYNKPQSISQVGQNKSAVIMNRKKSQNIMYNRTQQVAKSQTKSTSSSPQKKNRPQQVMNSSNFQENKDTDLSEFDYNEQEQSDRSFEKQEPMSKTIIQHSIFSNREPTIFFQYPDICEQKRPMVRTSYISEADQAKYQLQYKVFGQQPYKCIVSAFEYQGFTRDEEGDYWNVMWGIGSKNSQKSMNRFQKVNHFPGCWHMGRKDNLWINLSKMKRKFQKEYEFIPNTFLLAYDYERFTAQRDLAPKNTLWIMKPCASARGNGIKIISKKSKVSKKKNYLIMDYINKPHLINGIKYDLRIYVLISSFDPLRIYMYNEGLVRFATEKYSLLHKDLCKRFVHLTNFSVNKKSPAFIKNKNPGEDNIGQKWSHKALRKQYELMGLNYEAIFDSIKDVIIKTCIANEPFMLDSNAKSPEHKNGFFELYGFDILLDSDMKPWLLEVNVCPSLSSSSPLDKRIKTSLVTDTLHLIGVPVWDKTRKNKTPYKNNHTFSKNVNEIQSINEKNCQQRLSCEDWNMLMTTLEEKERSGNFECLYPNPETMHKYHNLFEYPRYNNKLIERFYQDESSWLNRLQ